MTLQEFQFKYTQGTTVKTLNIYAAETGIEFDYTDFNSGTGSCTWTSTSEQRPTRYYATTDDNWRPIDNSGSLKNAIKGKYGNNPNVLTMEASSSFFGDSSLHTYSNGKTLTFGSGSGTIKLSWYTWTDYVEGQPVSKAVNGGFYNITPDGNAPYICPNYPRFNYTDTGFPFDSENKPKMAFWIATMIDNVSNSATFNQKFPVMVISMKATGSGGATNTEQFAIIDLRLFNGTEPKPTAPTPKHNSTRNGWGGDRDTTTAYDNITTIPSAFNSTVNWGAHGLFLYYIDRDNLANLSTLLWSDDITQKFKNTMYSPSTGIISLHKLPISPTHVEDQEVVQVCGIKATGVVQEYTSFGGSIKEAPKVQVEASAYKCDRGFQCLSVPIYIKPFFNSFLDFEPYTTISVRLPFIGTVAIPTSSCMGGWIKTNYLIDCLNGNCVAQIYASSKRNIDVVENEFPEGWLLIGQYSGNCALPMAITGNSMGGQVQVGAVSGFASNAAGMILRGAANPVSVPTGLASSAIDLAMSTITAPHQTQVIGSLSANTTPLTDLTCRVIITRPWDVVPGEWRENGEFSGEELLRQAGLESFSGGKVSQYEGMTKGLILGKIDSANESEMNAIKAAFAGGVIV